MNADGSLDRGHITRDVNYRVAEEDNQLCVDYRYDEDSSQLPKGLHGSCLR